MGGIPPNNNLGVITPVQRQTINPMFINPNQRTFQSFNPNLPLNMYNNVTTGRSDYQNSPYFILPEGTTPVVTQVPVNNNENNNSVPAVYSGPSSTYYNNEDTAMSNLGVGGDDASFANPSSTGSYGGSLMTGGPSQESSDFFASATKNTAPPPTSGGGADGVGQLGALGDFFGGIGDAIGVTNYAEQAETPEAKARAKSESDSGTSGGK